MINLPEVPDDEPVMNKALNDSIAMCGYEPTQIEMTLQAWLMIGTEVLCRERGRARAVRILRQMIDHAERANPSRPWPL